MGKTQSRFRYLRWRGFLVVLQFRKEKDGLGYINVFRPDHPKAGPSGNVRKHILIAEKTLGNFLPDQAVVHHVDEDPSNNLPSNLVICESNSYHAFLHARLRAFRDCGHPDWRKCCMCHQWDDPQRLHITPNGKSAYHRQCNNRRHKEYMRRRRLENPRPPRTYNNRDPISGRFIKEVRENE